MKKDLNIKQQIRKSKPENRNSLLKWRTVHLQGISFEFYKQNFVKKMSSVFACVDKGYQPSTFQHNISPYQSCTGVDEDFESKFCTADAHTLNWKSYS